MQTNCLKKQTLLIESPLWHDEQTSFILATRSLTGHLRKSVLLQILS
jgi:hypothetical protein